MSSIDPQDEPSQCHAVMKCFGRMIASDNLANVKPGKCDAGMFSAPIGAHPEYKLPSGFTPGVDRVHQTLVLSNFARNSPEVKSEHVSAIESFVDYLVSDDDIEIEYIIGRASETGKEQYESPDGISGNIALSQARTENVWDILESRLSDALNDIDAAKERLGDPNEKTMYEGSKYQIKNMPEMKLAINRSVTIQYSSTFPSLLEDIGPEEIIIEDPPPRKKKRKPKRPDSDEDSDTNTNSDSEPDSNTSNKNCIYPWSINLFSSASLKLNNLPFLYDYCKEDFLKKETDPKMIDKFLKVIDLNQEFCIGSLNKHIFDYEIDEWKIKSSRTVVMWKPAGITISFVEYLLGKIGLDSFKDRLGDYVPFFKPPIEASGSGYSYNHIFFTNTDDYEDLSSTIWLNVTPIISVGIAHGSLSYYYLLSDSDLHCDEYTPNTYSAGVDFGAGLPDAVLSAKLAVLFVL